MSTHVKPYMADISFLQPVIDAYKYGAFDDKDLPSRVMNALDSLSWYGNVRVPYPESDLKVAQKLSEPKLKRKPYTRTKPHWKTVQKEAKEQERYND